MTHHCWPWYVNSAVLLASGMVTASCAVLLGWMAGQSHEDYRPALNFCLDLLGLFGNGCYR